MSQKNVSLWIMTGIMFLLIPKHVWADCVSDCTNTMNTGVTACAQTQQNQVAVGVDPNQARQAYESCARPYVTAEANCKQQCTGKSSATGGAAVGAVTLLNPIGLTDPRLIVGRIIKGVLSIIGTITLAMFIYGGFLWLTSMGESSKVQKGKSIFVWTTLGLAIIAGAYTAVNTVMTALTTGSITGSP